MDRKRIPDHVSNAEMKVDGRPKTATPLRRRREMQKKDKEEEERRRSASLDQSGLDQPKLLSTNQLNRLLRSSNKSINYASFRANNNSKTKNYNNRPRTAPSNSNARRAYRKTHVHVDPLRPHHFLHHKGNLTPILGVSCPSFLPNKENVKRHLTTSSNYFAWRRSY